MRLSYVSLLILAGLMGSAMAQTTAPVASTSVVAPASPAAAPFTAAQQMALEKTIHDYLVNHPEVLIEAGQALQMKQQQMMQEKASKVIPTLSGALLHDPSSPIAGNAKSTITVVEFFDYQCPHCKAMGPEIAALLAKNPDIKVIYKELPIFGADSEFAAKAALAAQRQGKYDAFHNALLNAPGRLSNQTVLDIAKSVGLDTNKLQADMNQPAIAEEIKAAATLASQIGIMGTPGFIIINEKEGKVAKSAFIPGQTTADDLAKNIQSVK